MSANIAICVLNTLVNWYSKLSGCIKWAGVCSQHFYMRCSVRLVSVISPLLFNFDINDLIIYQDWQVKGAIWETVNDISLSSVLCRVGFSV